MTGNHSHPKLTGCLGIRECDVMHATSFDVSWAQDGRSSTALPSLCSFCLTHPCIILAHHPRSRSAGDREKYHEYRGEYDHDHCWSGGRK